MSTPESRDEQLARLIFHKCISIMKDTLEMEEFSYRERGRNDPRYKTFKKRLMETTYGTLRQMFQELADLGFVESTNYDEDVKHGYKDNDSGGSGYLNTPSLNEWLMN